MTDAIRLAEQAAAWTAAHPIGSPVRYHSHPSHSHLTKVRSAAWVLSGHTVVAMVDGIAGGVNVDFLSDPPLAEATPPVVTNDPSRYIKRGDLVATNDAVYTDRDAPGQPDRMTFSNLEADADGYVTAKHDPT